MPFLDGQPLGPGRLKIGVSRSMPVPVSVPPPPLGPGLKAWARVWAVCYGNWTLQGCCIGNLTGIFRTHCPHAAS